MTTTTYNYNSTTLQLQLRLQLQLQLRYTTLHPAVVVRWPLQPLQPLQKTQLQPPFGPSVDPLFHPWVTTTNLSYRFPIFETSATALCGTTGIYHYIPFTPVWAILMRAIYLLCSGDSLNPKTSDIASLCSCAPKAQHHLHPTAARCWTPVANLLLHTVASHGVSACVVVSLFSAQKLSLADLGSCRDVGATRCRDLDTTRNLTISAY